MTAERTGPDRASEVARAYAEVEKRLQSAVEAAGRARGDVTLVAVTKTFPAGDVDLLVGLGQQDMGESRDQEGGPKALMHPELRWHFVGQLQSNKARSVATWANVVHTLDRTSLIAPLHRGWESSGRAALEVLIQVSLDGDPARGGVGSDGVDALADAAAEAGLTVSGVMAVAPRGGEPIPAFTQLERISTRLRRSHPAAEVISAGMSGDLEAAIACGATLVRVGTALLGGRPPAGH